ncbi:HBS1-like protein [Leucoagaricus sp. SymC.cos]|nr:HBS1-like protein [Leucoagaricus sp. SymC.cos]
MSRHRDIRNLNIDEELDDDALSDGGEERMTQEEEDELYEALEKVRAVIGSAQTSGISDKELRDCLWHEYYDVQKAVDWALVEQERRHAAQERKEKNDDSALEYWKSRNSGNNEDFSRVPKIILAQQLAQQQADQQEVYEQPYLTIEDDDGTESPIPQHHWTELSTITERTELVTEPSPAWQSRSLPPPTRRGRAGADSSRTTSYGEELPDDSQTQRFFANIMDQETPRQRPKSLQPSSTLDSSVIPTIRLSSATPTNVSESPAQETPPPEKPLPDRPSSIVSKKSKLASLASSRSRLSIAASSLSGSSRDDGTSVSGSVKTFPNLRPSPLSDLSPTTTPPSLPSKDPPSGSTSSFVSEEASSHGTGVSEMTAQVQKAIQAALQLEALDRTLSDVPASPSPATPRDSIGSAKPKSKLALLAQQKISATKAPKLPAPKTEYLVPTANGATATTAITTSYQSLFTLTDPKRPAYIPKLEVAPLPTGQVVTGTHATKTSKLAMKVKRANEKSAVKTPAEEPEETLTTSLSPIFQDTSRSRASPSAFASVLARDDLMLFKPSRRSKDELERQSGSEEPISRKSHVRKSETIVPSLTPPSAFAFDSPSPDDIVFNARRGTSLAQEREKAQKIAAQRSAGGSAASSRAPTPSGTVTPKKKIPVNANINVGTSVSARGSIKISAPPTPVKAKSVDQSQLDISALGLSTTVKTTELGEPPESEEVPKTSFAREKLLEEAKRHVDAGKSTLMGRLLYELGRLDEKTRRANERGSSKAGKSSFSWAWGLDGTAEERERGITMDIAQQFFSTPHRQVTVLDAPGHKDFVPNMISGASQTDCALLVVDAATGEFEAGFERGGQTREHVLLVRSLGVSQVIVAINKLDQVEWSQARYDEIESSLRPFLVQSGFAVSKTSFVPVGAILGVNMVSREGEDAKQLSEWYFGPTLVDCLDKMEPPARDYANVFRLPISNIFKSQSTSGVYVAGRIASGVIQVGEKVRATPGDDTVTGVVKSIEVEDAPVNWAMAGTNATISLTNIDPVNLSIGSVLCYPGEAVALAGVFTARIIVFDIAVPITAGASVELFNQSRDVPATTSKLLALIDRTTGEVSKKNPRVLVKNTSAEIEISLQNTRSATGPKGIPLEPFSSNKDMGRILLRRGGETIAAGVVLQILS